MLDEIAYAYGSMTTAFSISTLMPRTRISESCLISDISGVSTGLVVEIGEDSLEPLLFLCDLEPAPTV